MADKFQYDVFVSYASKDRAWIKKNLLPKFKQRGIKACVDYIDFPAGRSAMINMRDAVKKSRHTLLVMTPNWVNSEWTFFEALLSRGKDPAGYRQRTIPMLVKKCKVDDILSTLSWVNLTERDSKAIAWNQLYTALGKKPVPKRTKQIRTKKNANWHLAHPYGMPPNFTGRLAEREMLSRWLNEDSQHPLFVLRALGGFGKSALSWYWLTHDVDSTRWPKVLWWSFYEGDASFEHFLKDTLKYLGVENAEQINPSLQTEILLNLLQNSGILLVMDGFERALRAYGNMGAAYQADELQKDKLDTNDTSRDCVNPFAETFLRSICAYGSFLRGKVLMTTRLTPRAVESRGQIMQGCLEKELQAMDKDDVIAFFRSEGIRGTRAEIQEACAHYGFHPLSLRLLAGLIISDLQTPGDITVAKRLDISKNIVQNKHHVLEQAYRTMPKERQSLLSRIACFRAPVTYDALKAIVPGDEASGKSGRSKSRKAGKPSKRNVKNASRPIKAYEGFEDDLRDLLARGLLYHDTKTNKYDLHPIVRRYAYDRLTAADRTGAHGRLVNYFDAVPKPEKVKTLEDLAPVIELYHHMVMARKLDDAFVLFRDRLTTALYFQLGAYQLIAELLRALFLENEDKPPRLKSENYQAWTLNTLAAVYSLSGQPRRAVSLFEIHNVINEKAGNKDNLARGLGNVANMAQIYIGALSAAEQNLSHAISLSHEIDDEDHVGTWQYFLGQVLIYCGKWDDSEESLQLAEEIKKKTNHLQAQSVLWSYRTQRFLLMAREAVVSNQLSVDSLKSAIQCAKRALELADEQAKDIPVPRDYVRAHWLLGAAYRANNELTLAEENLSKSLNLCRQINLVDHEADILLDLARLSYAQGDFKDAQEKASEALVITERSGYVLQGADVNLFLAQYALEQEKDKVKAKAYAEEAKKLAYCDGGEYKYKVAYEEAERMLERLK